MPANMLTVQTFVTSKDGEPTEDCEDSIHPMPGCAADDVPLVAFAVSDGVTTSFFGGVWAQMLTARFAECPAAVFDPSSSWVDWLKPPQDQWQAEMRKRAAAETASFYMRNDVVSRRPAAATFVGLLLDSPAPDGTIPWRALVLGDSCLFILRKDRPHSLKLTKATEFSNIVSSAESYACDRPFQPDFYRDEKPLEEGDTVLLATDALSKWLLLRDEEGHPVWGTILGLTGRADFETLVGHARREERNPLENDDVALGIISIGQPHQLYRAARFEPRPRPVPQPRAPKPESRLPVPLASANGHSGVKKRSGRKSERDSSKKTSRRMHQELKEKTRELDSLRKKSDAQSADLEKALKELEALHAILTPPAPPPANPPAGSL